MTLSITLRVIYNSEPFISVDTRARPVTHSILTYKRFLLLFVINHNSIESLITLSFELTARYLSLNTVLTTVLKLSLYLLITAKIKKIEHTVNFLKFTDLQIFDYFRIISYLN